MEQQPAAGNQGPASVPARAMQAGDPRARRWAWAEPSVWTDRMLQALEQGVKGGCWFSLIDKVYKPANLWSSWSKVAANDGAAGVDHMTVQRYEHQVEEHIEHVTEQLKAGTYRPRAIRRCHIPKPGSNETRPLGIPTVQDRVVQGALRHVLEPIFEKDFHQHSYGFRPGKGCKDALRRVQELLDDGYRYVVDADLKGYFDTIPHDQLMQRVREKIADGRVLKLIESFLTQGVLEGLEQWIPSAGAPQGAVLSPLLSNIYLDPLDHLMARRGLQMVRYADDFVILCQSREQAERALEQVQQWTAQAGLTLHPQKTRIVDEQTEGFDFLGYHFGQSQRQPREKSLKKFKDAIRVKTPRLSGRSMDRIIASVNQTTRGWFEYFKHSRRETFPPLDSWIRMRLRSILRKRNGGEGRGHGLDHRRWPNKFFARAGLFSLLRAHRLACQSARSETH
jgi:RNA-directed DNA polymerase